MVIKQEKQERCYKCKKMITVREYEGLEGSWYTDHHCEGKK